MPRPAMHENKRTERVQVFLSPSELERLKDAADERPLARIARRLLMEWADEMLEEDDE